MFRKSDNNLQTLVFLLCVRMFPYTFVLEVVTSRFNVLWELICFPHHLLLKDL